MKQTGWIYVILSFAILVGLGFLFMIPSRIQDKSRIQATIDVAEEQLGYQAKIILDAQEIKFPRSGSNGVIRYENYAGWTSGFFPGSLWHLYELTGLDKWRDLAITFTKALDSVQYITWHHDVGFVASCSYGNALRLTKEEQYAKVMVETARSLSSRFRPSLGVIQSWDAKPGNKRGWTCPVCIDNMMNLELLFEATHLSGDSSFYKIAVSHADRMIKDAFRKDYSSYHVIDYDPQTGEIIRQQTLQGADDESAWSRGQAWAFYGYVFCYRYTKDRKYLRQALNAWEFMSKHPNMPTDLVPYWDFDAPNIPHEPRDVSTAAVCASALYELSEYAGKKYKKTADQIMTSLMSDSYRAIVGTNCNFLLMHYVGSLPEDLEIDVPCNYADYYFLEALNRKVKLEK